MKITQTLFEWLTKPYQLVIRNDDDLAEKKVLRFSYAKLCALAGMLLVMMVACSVALSNTILAWWLNPAYIERENRQKLSQLAHSIADLKVQNEEQQQFIGTLKAIITGKEVTAQLPATTTPPAAVAPTIHQESNGALTDDTALVSDEPFDDTTALLPTTQYNTHDSLQTLFLFPPVNGIITRSFRKELAHYGVDIVAKECAPIKCVADGTVLLAEYTLATGWVIIIQHAKNLISIYKHNASVLKKVGSFVKAGDVIAIMGNSGELSSGPHLHFELWYEGNAVNPAHFITL